MTLKGRPENRCAADRYGAFTLLEVILALAVLAIGLAIIGEANNSADQNARRAALESDATVVAESVMTELVSRVRALTPVDGAAWDGGEEQTRWSFRIAIEPTAHQGLLAARVTAYETQPVGSAPVSVALVRWLADPATLPPESETNFSSSEGTL